MSNLGDGVWDDGEWISWDSINQHLHEQELRELFPNAPRDVIEVFEELVRVASNYKTIAGRYIPVWGELGELFAEITFDIKRHKPGTPGSDGFMGDELVEIKTISPDKKKAFVQVKRKGNFTKLVVVRISADFQFEARTLERGKIGNAPGKFAKVSWSSMQSQRPVRSESP